MRLNNIHHVFSIGDFQSSGLTLTFNHWIYILKQFIFLNLSISLREKNLILVGVYRIRIGNGFHFIEKSCICNTGCFQRFTNSLLFVIDDFIESLPDITLI